MPRGQQRLMGVAEGRVGDAAAASVRSTQRGELLRPQFPEAVARCRAAARLGDRDRRDRSAARRHRSRRRLPACSPFDSRMAVDDDVGDVRQQLAWPGPGAAADRNSSGVSSMKRVVQPPARNVGMRDEVEQERDVRLDAADAEFLQACAPCGGPRRRSAGRGPSP